MRATQRIKMAQQLSRYESVISEMTSGTEARQERPRSAWRALGYDLGLLHTKVIKSVFCCLTDSQQIGKYMNNSLAHSEILTLCHKKTIPST